MSAAALSWCEVRQEAERVLRARPKIGALQQMIGTWADDHWDQSRGEELEIARDLADADRVASVAHTPALQALAREMRDDVERRAAAIWHEREAILRAFRASDARIHAAVKWWKSDWREAFRREVR